MDCPNCQEPITKLIEPTLEVVGVYLMKQFGCPECHALLYDFEEQEDLNEYGIDKVADHASPGTSVCIMDFDNPERRGKITHETWKEFAERYA